MCALRKNMSLSRICVLLFAVIVRPGFASPGTVMPYRASYLIMGAGSDDGQILGAKDLGSLIVRDVEDG